MTPWFLDACSLINLYASGLLATLVQKNGHPFLVVQTVMEEASWVYGRQGLERGERQTIPYPLLIEEGQLSIVAPTAAMLQRFVAYAADMDDGEAMTLAAALETSASGVVTDDEAAMQHVAQAGVPVSDSLTLMRTVLEGANVSLCYEVLLNVRICARYLPGKHHPQYAWWTSLTEGAAEHVASSR